MIFQFQNFPLIMEKMDETSDSMCENVKVTQMYHNIPRLVIPRLVKYPEVGEIVQLVEDSVGG